MVLIRLHDEDASDHSDYDSDGTDLERGGLPPVKEEQVADKLLGGELLEPLESQAAAAIPVIAYPAGVTDPAKTTNVSAGSHHSHRSLPGQSSKGTPRSRRRRSSERRHHLFSSEEAVPTLMGTRAGALGRSVSFLLSGSSRHAEQAAGAQVTAESHPTTHASGSPGRAERHQPGARRLKRPPSFVLPGMLSPDASSVRVRATASHHGRARARRESRTSSSGGGRQIRFEPRDAPAGAGPRFMPMSGSGFPADPRDRAMVSIAGPRTAAWHVASRPGSSNRLGRVGDSRSRVAPVATPSTPVADGPGDPKPVDPTVASQENKAVPNSGNIQHSASRRKRKTGGRRSSVQRVAAQELYVSSAMAANPEGLISAMEAGRAAARASMRQIQAATSPVEVSETSYDAPLS